MSDLSVLKLEINNVLRVDAMTIEPNGNHVVINGKNGSGKSSTLNALWGGLKGLGVKEYPEPLRRGQKRGTSCLDLGEYVVKRIFTEKSQRLDLFHKGKKVEKNAQELLNSFLGTYSLDPSKFLQLKPRDQVDVVLKIAGVKPPVEAVLKIAGDEPVNLPRDGETAEEYLMRLSADETGVWYDRRRQAHRIADDKLAALQESQQQLEKMGGPLHNLNDKLISASDMAKKLEKLQKQADQYRELEKRLDGLKLEQDDAKQRLDSLGRDVERVDADIADLQQRLEAKQREREELRARIKKGKAVVHDCECDVLAADAKLKVAHNPVDEMRNVRGQLASIERQNEDMTARKIKVSEIDRLQREYEKAISKHKDLDWILEQLRALRVHLLDNLDLGVEGLTISDGELVLNGISSRQASQAERMRMACAIATAEDPRLKLLRLDNAESLDAESKRVVFEMAQERGWQVWMAAVSEDKELRVEIHDREEILADVDEQPANA